MSSVEDDFWNESSSSALNFFDDDDDSPITETESFNINVQENITLPMHSIISNKCLKLVLEDTDAFFEPAVYPADETIKRMFFGESFVLSSYKSLEQKLMLLDSSLELCDGNILITVILFLYKTLNKNIFLTELSKRKVAVKHYANYLIDRHLLQELADVYMATGNIQNLKDIYCFLTKDASNAVTLHKKVEQFNLHHAQNLCNEDKLEIFDHFSFLDFQIKNQFHCKSLVEQLVCLYEKDCSDDFILNFKKQFKIDDLQFEWVLMSFLCKTQNWERLSATFIKTVLFLKKRALKSVMRPELFVLGIGKYNPPEKVLEQFLSCITDTAKVLYLAEKLKMHMFVVNYFVEQKDKSALLKYMERIEPGNPALFAIQSTLHNLVRKEKSSGKIKNTAFDVEDGRKLCVFF